MVKLCCSTLLGNRHTRVTLSTSYNLIIKIQTRGFVWTPILIDIESIPRSHTYLEAFLSATYLVSTLPNILRLLSLVTSQNPKITTIILSLYLSLFISVNSSSTKFKVIIRISHSSYLWSLRYIFSYYLLPNDFSSHLI